MSASEPRWQINGDYFESCNCDVVCPCLFSPNPPFASQPTEGACEVAFAFHIDEGSYGDTRLDGLNAAMAVRTPGAMGDGNWSLALYLDERADDQQREALHAIFSGAAGGPIAALAPLVSTILGLRIVPISWHKEGRRRSVEIPNLLHMGVQAAPSLHRDEAIWASNAHPFASPVAMAVSDEGNVWNDYGMQWDNSGKNGHYAPISWSNS